MKKYYVVGHEKTRASMNKALLCVVGFIVIGYMTKLYVGYIMMFWALAVVMLLICFMIGFEANWIVKEDCIEYTSVVEVAKYKRILSILFKNKQYPHVKQIPYDNIDYGEISFSEVSMTPYGSYGYPIYMNIHTIDHQTKKLEIYVNESKQQHLPALEYLSQKIDLRDPFNIMENLKDKNESLANYIIRIIKERNIKVH